MDEEKLRQQKEAMMRKLKQLATQQTTSDATLNKTYNIKQIKDGDNKTYAKEGAEVWVHYKGFFPNNGIVFDSSVQRGKPIKFEAGVGQVIKCWDDILMRMSEGEKLMVVCPSNKAYGPNGAGKIPPYTDIAFEMELLKINNPKSNDQYKMFDPKFKNDK